jgi:hypothetical protein
VALADRVLMNHQTEHDQRNAEPEQQWKFHPKSIGRSLDRT